MARGLNKVMVIGFVEHDPEVRRTVDGKLVTSFSVSTKRHWTTNAGEARTATEWFTVVAWGTLAETAQQCLRKGQRLYTDGHVQTRSWQDSAGMRQVRTEVVAQKLIPMGSKEVLNTWLSSENPQTPLCLNRVMVIGNLGCDPEMRYTPSGHAVTAFSLAATRRWTTASRERRDATEWFNVVAWGSLAEICNQYLSKGRRVYVEGELRTRTWVQPDGTKQFRTELAANEMIMLGPRPSTPGTDLESDLTTELPF